MNRNQPEIVSLFVMVMILGFFMGVHFVTSKLALSTMITEVKQTLDSMESMASRSDTQKRVVMESMQRIKEFVGYELRKMG